MSRTDQWIGLTSDAKKFIYDFLSNKKYNIITKEYRVLIDSNSSLTGCEFKGIYIEFTMNIQNNSNERCIIEEVPQEIPWSHGPMYYTCLKYSCIKNFDNSKLELSNLYEWRHDFRFDNSNEFDCDKGVIFV